LPFNVGLLAVAVAIVASLVWAFAPLCTHTSNEVTIHISEYAMNGGLALLVFIPVVFTIAELFLIVLNTTEDVSKLTLWVAPVACLVFCIYGFFSVGLFHIPTTIVLIIAAVLAIRHN